MKRTFTLKSISTLSLALYCVGVNGAVNNEQRPNIIFILTDDQPYALLNYTGNETIQTPNLNHLAQEGVFCHGAHVSSAISTPSRTSILTGRFERNHGVNFNSSTSLSAEGWAESYPVLLREGGYYTGYIGKNHSPIGKGGYSNPLMESSYDYWYGSHTGVGFYPQSKHEIYKGAHSTTQPEVLSEGAIDFLNPNERGLEGAISFMKSRPKDQPFFLNICMNLPHNSSTSQMAQRESDPEIYKSLYRDKEIKLSKHYVAKEDIKEPKLPLEIHHVADRQASYNYVDTPETAKERVLRCMQAVTGIDKLVGDLLEELKRQGLDKNTIIIYTSDHGIFKGEFGFGGKALCYEICTHVPFIIYDPRLPRKVRSRDNDELVLTIDIPATILDYANIETPEGYQGESLIPLLEGEATKVRDYLFTENLWSTTTGNPRCESVQNKEWKYIRYYKNENHSSVEIQRVADKFGLSTKEANPQQTISNYLTYRNYVEAGLRGEGAAHEELFNLKSDPDETTNLAGDKRYSDKLEQMRKEWYTQLKYARGEGEPMVEIMSPSVKP